MLNYFFRTIFHSVSLDDLSHFFITYNFNMFFLVAFDRARQPLFIIFVIKLTDSLRVIVAILLTAMQHIHPRCIRVGIWLKYC
jgi:hypothetical protein